MHCQKLPYDSGVVRQFFSVNWVIGDGISRQQPSLQNKKLPQTGNDSQINAELLGLVSLEAVLLLLIAKKKKNGEDK